MDNKRHRRSKIEDRKGIPIRYPIYGPRSSVVWRLLDANANRAREGLRVIEDTARFILSRADAADAMRKLRHKLDGQMRSRYKVLLNHRNVYADSGRHNAADPYKGGLSDLLAANFKRVEEALRVLEEHSRILNTNATRSFQQLRFQAYIWEKKLYR